ncbi:FidL-like protein [Pantoea agglomerans]|uniref:FidL-like protein n=1 Tax=Enterobacter agglomerans TaxID=549 RepID=UPI000A509E74|nr:FidL-like protein [Pantoea agglomerans]SUB19703.1 Uncharacterised protein [Pantoea agglomerans]
MLTITLAALILMFFAGINYFKRQASDLPFRCSAFSRYDLSRHEGNKFEFRVSQDLRFENKQSGYLLLNGQALSGGNMTLVNRRVRLINGAKVDDDTYRYEVDKIVISATDTTLDASFNNLLAEIMLDSSHLQLDVTKVDDNAYLIGGPLSYLFLCQRY